MRVYRNMEKARQRNRTGEPSNNHLSRIVLSQELQRQAWQLVRLRKNRGTSLLQDIQSSQVRSFLSYIHVSDPALSCHKILSRHSKVRDRGGKS
jgi:phosphopantetheine adenylyltransferase